MSILSFLKRLETHKQAKNVYVKFNILRGSNDFAIFAAMFFTFKMKLFENK